MDRLSPSDRLAFFQQITAGAEEANRPAFEKILDILLEQHTLTKGTLMVAVPDVSAQEKILNILMTIQGDTESRVNSILAIVHSFFRAGLGITMDAVVRNTVKEHMTDMPESEIFLIMHEVRTSLIVAQTGPVFGIDLERVKTVSDAALRTFRKIKSSDFPSTFGYVGTLLFRKITPEEVSPESPGPLYPIPLSELSAAVRKEDSAEQALSTIDEIAEFREKAMVRTFAETKATMPFMTRRSPREDEMTFDEEDELDVRAFLHYLSTVALDLVGLADELLPPDKGDLTGSVARQEVNCIPYSLLEAMWLAFIAQRFPAALSHPRMTNVDEVQREMRQKNDAFSLLFSMLQKVHHSVSTYKGRFPADLGAERILQMADLSLEFLDVSLTSFRRLNLIANSTNIPQGYRPPALDESPSLPRTPMPEIQCSKIVMLEQSRTVGVNISLAYAPCVRPFASRGLQTRYIHKSPTLELPVFLHRSHMHGGVSLTKASGIPLAAIVGKNNENVRIAEFICRKQMEDLAYVIDVITQVTTGEVLPRLAAGLGDRPLNFICMADAKKQSAYQLVVLLSSTDTALVPELEWLALPEEFSDILKKAHVDIPQDAHYCLLDSEEDDDGRNEVAPPPAPVTSDSEVLV